MKTIKLCGSSFTNPNYTANHSMKAICARPRLFCGKRFGLVSLPGYKTSLLAFSFEHRSPGNLLLSPDLNTEVLATSFSPQESSVGDYNVRAGKKRRSASIQVIVSVNSIVRVRIKSLTKTTIHQRLTFVGAMVKRKTKKQTPECLQCCLTCQQAFVVWNCRHFSLS